MPLFEKNLNKVCFTCIVMQEASDAHSKTADSDTVSTYQVSSVQLKRPDRSKQSLFCFSTFFRTMLNSEPPTYYFV